MPSFSFFPQSKVIGIDAGRLYVQPGETWTTTERGPDTGHVQWLTSPDTPESSWPKRGDRSSRYPFMIVDEVDAVNDESGLVLLTAKYRGTKNRLGGVFKVKLRGSSDTSLFSLPTLTGTGGAKQRSLARVPHPRKIREFLTTTAPDFNGVGSSVTADFLAAGSQGDFNLAFTPDPDETPTHNLINGWKIDSRTWEDIGDAGLCWFVTEIYAYDWAIAG